MQFIVRIKQSASYGHDPESQKDYWLLRNSWSTHWGVDGYMKIAMSGNTCGVANAPTFPVLEY